MGKRGKEKRRRKASGYSSLIFVQKSVFPNHFYWCSVWVRLRLGKYIQGGAHLVKRNSLCLEIRESALLCAFLLDGVEFLRNF